MYNIFSTIDTSNLSSVISWIVITFAAVLGACIVDLFYGINKAKKAGIARTSTALRKSCTKAQHYFLPMVCLAFGDILASTLVPFPPFCGLYGLFCIICEFKSVLEKSSTKNEIREAANTMSVILKNKDDLARALIEVMNQAKCEGTKQNENKEHQHVD